MSKYKNCCDGKVPWEGLLDGPVAAGIPHFSARGKNRVFLHSLMSALQLDGESPPKDLQSFKRAFTPSAVRQIFEAVHHVWPNPQDLRRVLQMERLNTSGLYVGNYEPTLVLEGITRHTLYSDRLLLVDPFPFPAIMSRENDPRERPEMFRSVALKWTTLWLNLAPWIEQGLVAFIRTPGDFDVELLHRTFRAGERRYKEHPELEELSKAEVDRPDMVAEFERMQRHLALSTPDQDLLRRAREGNPSITKEEEAAMLAYLDQERTKAPYFVTPLDAVEGSSEILQTSSGTNYEMAKVIATETGSFLMTDLPTRWREIELDRADAGIDADQWSPLAKAFDGVPFRYLNRVPLAAALRLRQEGRLESMRAFLRRAWQAADKTNSFQKASATNLAAELQQKVDEADAEWKKIDADLLKTVSQRAATAAAAVAVGTASWVASALAGAGVAASELVSSRLERNRFAVKYPAGFFLRLRDEQLKD